MDSGFIDGGMFFIISVLVYLTYLNKVGGQVDGRDLVPSNAGFRMGYPVSFQFVSLIMLAQAWLAAYMVSPHVTGPFGLTTLGFYLLVTLLICVPVVIVVDAITTRITFDGRSVIKTRLFYRREIRWQQIETVVSDHAWHSYVLVGVEQNGQRRRIAISRYSVGLKTFLKFLSGHVPVPVVEPITADLEALQASDRPPPAAAH